MKSAENSISELPPNLNNFVGEYTLRLPCKARAFGIRDNAHPPATPVTKNLATAPYSRGAIHSTKIPTGPTGKSGPPQKVDPFFRNFSGWTEPIH